jgi:putative ABC transport system ATP-binding protein
MLRMQGVTKAYQTDSIRTLALNGISLTVDAGDFLAVMGPSGCGKTTFLNVAGLLDTFEGGTYWLDGTDVSKLRDAAMSKIRNQKIGFVFQSFNLIPDLNVFDNIDVPLRYRGFAGKERRDRITRALETVGLSARTNHLPSQLSGGQQQRVAIARALVGEPKLILADEPTGNLDSHMAGEILDLLTQINESGATIVMVTHDPSIATRARRTIRLLDGAVLPETEVRDEPVQTVANATEAGIC